MISELVEFRRDGAVIHEDDSVDTIKSLGKTSRVIRVKWSSDGQTMERSNSFGVFVSVLPQRDALLCVELGDEHGLSSSLTVVNADGSVRFETPSAIEIEGQCRQVSFMQTYPNAGNNNASFAVVVDVPSLNCQYKVFIDSYSGKILETKYVR